MRTDDLRKDIRRLGSIGLDTSIFVYHFEGGRYSALTTVVFREIAEGRCSAVTSTLNLAETLVLPFRTGNLELADYYRSLFGSMPNLSLVEVDEPIAVEAAVIRARHDTRMPDSILLATACKIEAAGFLTNDPKLKRFDALAVLVLDDYA